MNRTATDWRVRILSALSDPTRLDIIEFLGKEERCVCEIVPAFGRAESTISKHLAVLVEAGILERSVVGKPPLDRGKNNTPFCLFGLVHGLAPQAVFAVEGDGEDPGTGGEGGAGCGPDGRVVRCPVERSTEATRGGNCGGSAGR